MPVADETVQQVRRDDGALGVSGDEDGIGRMDIAHPIEVGSEI